MIPYGRQDIDARDVDAVVAALRSDYLTQGPLVPEFEQKVATYCGVEHAVACNSATSALHLACLALGVGPGDLVWSSPNTFVASANCALYCGAQVDFVDIDPANGLLSVSALTQKLEQAQRQGALPKVVIPVHFAGLSCDMPAIKKLADHYGFHIIEDAAHAIGSAAFDHKVGACRYSDITVFSFHPVKIITTAEGGMALCRDAELARRMRQLATHGISRDAHATGWSGSISGDWVYEQQMLGFNYRLSDLHAALGISQLARLDDFVQRRNALARRYDEAFSGSSLQPMTQRDESVNAYHLYVVRLPEKLNRQQVFDQMRAADIGVHVHYIPVYKQPWYQQLGFAMNYCPGAERYYAQTLTLPLFPGLSEQDQGRVIETLKQVCLSA
jgi:UDP-4-amino-4,6-dideoxy-N-acetyl-beta-L-altrosamine transaminase